MAYSKNSAYQGTFKPRNAHKYKGNHKNVIYRSTWERLFMKYCDRSTSIIEWSSEEVVVPYVSPLDNTIHRYFPDFWLKAKKPDGDLQEYIIEIKPYKYSVEPILKLTEKRRKPTKTYLHELEKYQVNKAKWEAADRYCKRKDQVFLVITEKDIFGKSKAVNAK